MDKLISKEGIRKEIIIRRENLSDSLVNSFSEIIRMKLENLKIFKEAKTMLCYISKGKEVSTEEIIRKSIESNKRVVAPRVDVYNQKIILHEIRNFDSDITHGFKGILEPKEHMQIVKKLDSIDLAVVPGIAFDINGRRIGFGKGFFDKLLAKKNIHPILCGLAFDFQIFNDIPYSSHDICMDIIISEKRIIWC